MTRVRVVFSKWDGRPHWEYDARRLGEDEHGTWLGLPVGTRISRPGASILTGERQVVLVPADRSFVATFYDGGGASPFEVYVDISSTPTWSEDVMEAVDLDLDVIRGRSGRVWVDDEDEFARHRVSLGYPDAVSRLALRTCEEVRHEVEAGRAPYDGVVAAGWLGRLDAAMMNR